MTLFRILLAVALAVLASAVQAQVPSKPKEFYFYPDTAAVPIIAVKGEGETLVQSLIKARELGRDVVESTAQLAHISFQTGKIDLGKQLYTQAIGDRRVDRGIGRSIVWNYAWDLFRAGEYQEALKLWAPLEKNALREPNWAPPTLALVLWNLDRKNEATQWYAAAVRTEPQLWTDPANFPKLLPDWREEDRAVLREVFVAWQTSPPAWP
jgi:tetratricopeptide (TPR) repeat protein